MVIRLARDSLLPGPRLRNRGQAIIVWTPAISLCYTLQTRRPAWAVNYVSATIQGDFEMSEQVEEKQETRVVNAPANPDLPELRAGDTVNVHLRIKEGDRERIQEFQGTVIRMSKGGNAANFTVRRTASHSVGVERTFLLRSPLLEKVEILRRAKVRRAQLYFLRDRTGKRARLKERRES